MRKRLVVRLRSRRCVCVCDIGVLMLKRFSTCLNGANLNFQTQPKLANDVIDGKRD